MIRRFICFLMFFAATYSYGQVIIDSCMTSAVSGPLWYTYPSDYLVSIRSADLVQWNGEDWGTTGTSAELTIPSPSGEIGCRAIWVGAGIGWTINGEKGAMLLDAPLEAGEVYSFPFTYVSHSEASDGAFAPKVWTNSIPDMEGSTYHGSLEPAGYEWHTSVFTFVASDSSDGDTWLIVGTDNTVSSGFISSFCSECTLCDTPIELGLNDTLCAGETKMLNAEIPNATYTWQDGSEGSSFEVHETGHYWVNVESETCSLSDSIYVIIADSIDINLGADTTLCPEATLILDSTSDLGEYTWQDDSGNSTFEVSEPGVYWVEAMNLCSFGSDTIEVDYIAPLSIDLGNDTSICIGSSIDLAGWNIDSSYEWQDGSDSPEYEVVDAGLYWLEVSNTCEVIRDSIEVQHIEALSIDFGSDTVLCSGSNLILTTDVVESSFEWQDLSNEPSFLVEEPGLYWVEATNICESTSDTIEVFYVDPYTVNIGNDTTICESESLNLNIETVFGSYTWQDGSELGMLEANSPGLYWVTVENACGSDSDTLLLFQDNPVVFSLGTDTSICAGTSITLSTDIEEYSLEWQDGSVNSQFETDQESWYWLSITNTCGVFSDSIYISVLYPPEVYLGEHGTLCPGDSIVFDVTFPESTYLWQDLSTEPVYTAYYPEGYRVVVANKCGVAEDYIEFDCIQVSLPNIFTPNGDGRNDVYQPFLTGDMWNYQFRIFNRWGQEVFYTESQVSGWDGTQSGTPLPDGTYFAIVAFSDYKGETQQFSGEFVLKAK